MCNSLFIFINCKLNAETAEVKAHFNLEQQTDAKGDFHFHLLNSSSVATQTLL